MEDNKKYKILERWSFPEYVKYHKSKKWWVGFVVLNIIFIIISIFNTNFIFILILLIIDAIIIFREFEEPENIDFAITSHGILIDNRLYEWGEFDSFWIAYRPPEVKKIYFVFKSKFKTPLSVPLEDKNPLKIRKILGDLLMEDLEREDEETIDTLNRILKI